MVCRCVCSGARFWVFLEIRMLLDFHLAMDVEELFSGQDGMPAKENQSLISGWITASFP